MIAFLALYLHILAAMQLAQPVAARAVLESYPAQAWAIATVVLTEGPLFDGDDGQLLSADVVVETAVEEGALRLDADDHRGNLCEMQVSAYNARRLGYSRAEMLTSYAACFRAGYVVLRESIAACAGRPRDEQLTAYMAMGARCIRSGVPVRRSRYRMRRAVRLLVAGQRAGVVPPT